MALIRVRTVWSGVAGAPWYTNSHFEGTGDSAHATQAVQALDAFFDLLVASFHAPVTWVIEGNVSLIDIATGDLIGVRTVTPAGGSATGAGDGLPPTSQLLVQMHTSFYLGGRELRGRMFLPAQTEANNTATGVPAPAYCDGVKTGAQTLADNAANWAVYSRKKHAVATVSTCTVWSQWAVLRSRRD